MYIGRKFIILDRQNASPTCGKYPITALRAKAPRIMTNGRVFFIAGALPSGDAISLVRLPPSMYFIR